MSLQVTFDEADHRDIHIWLDVPRVKYVGNNKSGTIRVNILPSGYDYGAFQKDIPETVYNLVDLKWFAHPSRAKNFEIIIQRMLFPQYVYHNLESHNKYWTKALAYCTAVGAKHINPPDEFKDAGVGEIGITDQTTALENEKARIEAARQIYDPEPKKFKDMTVSELKTLAKSSRIANFSNLKKAELVDALTKEFKADFIDTSTPSNEPKKQTTTRKTMQLT